MTVLGIILVLVPFLAFAIIVYMIGYSSGRFCAAKYRDALWDVIHDRPDAKEARENAEAVLAEWEKEWRDVYGGRL